MHITLSTHAPLGVDYKAHEYLYETNEPKDREPSFVGEPKDGHQAGPHFGNCHHHSVHVDIVDSEMLQGDRNELFNAFEVDGQEGNYEEVFEEGEVQDVKDVPE